MRLEEIVGMRERKKKRERERVREEEREREKGEKVDVKGGKVLV